MFFRRAGASLLPLPLLSATRAGGPLELLPLPLLSATCAGGPRRGLQDVVYPS